MAFFSPNASSFYFNILLGLRKELVRYNIDVHVGWGYLDALQMAQFCTGFKPDIVVEIDRTRKTSAGLPATVKHVAWLQDWRSVSVDASGRSNMSFGGSDLYLFVTRPEAIGFKRSTLSNWGYLLIGTDPEIFSPGELPIESDFTLMGYVPPKDTLGLIDRSLSVNLLGSGPPWHVPALGNYGELLEALRQAGLTWDTYDVSQSHRKMNEYVFKRLGFRRPAAVETVSMYGGVRVDLIPETECVIPDEILYEIENLLMRAQSRKAVIDKVLRVSDSLRLFGITGWDTYPEFRDKFRGPLPSEIDVRNAFLSTRVNLHNAMSQVHARVLDCMATGSAILVNETNDVSGNSPDSLRATMESGVDYFEYNADNLTEIAKEAVENTERRKKVAAAGRKAVLAHHTWAQRADQLISYLADI